MKGADKLFAPSETARGVYNYYYEDLDIDVIEHGYTPVEQLSYEKHNNISYEISDRFKSDLEIIRMEAIDNSLYIKGWISSDETIEKQVRVGVRISEGKREQFFFTDVKNPEEVHFPQDKEYGYNQFEICIPLKDFTESALLSVSIVLEYDGVFYLEARPPFSVANSNVLPNKSLNVGFIGMFNQSKGTGIMADLFERMEDADCNFFILGGIGAAEIKDFNAKKNVHLLGEYEREHLPRILNNLEVDLICIPSIWEETYCYTATEALYEGVPILTTNVGAQAERTQRLDAGWVVSVDNAAEEMSWQLNELIDNPTLLHQKMETSSKIQFKTVTAMAEEYAVYYETFPMLENRNPDSDYFRNMFKRAYKTPQINKAESREKSVQKENEIAIKHLQKELEKLATQYHNVLGSKMWGITRPIRWAAQFVQNLLGR